MRRFLKEIFFWVIVVTLYFPAGAALGETASELKTLLAPYWAAPAKNESPSAKYDLRACIELAMQRHPSINADLAAAAAIKSRLAVREVENRLLRFKMKGDAIYTRGESLGTVALLRGVDEEGISQGLAKGSAYHAYLTNELPIFQEGRFIGQTVRAVDQARLDVHEQEWKSQSSQIEISKEVMQDYFELLKDQGFAQIAEKKVTLQDTLYKKAQADYEQERTTKTDLIAAELKALQAKTELSQLHISHQQAMRNFSRMIGEVNNEQFAVENIYLGTPGSLPPLDELVAKIQQHPQIKAQGVSLEKSRQELKKIQAGYLPSLALRTNYGVGGIEIDGSLTKNLTATVDVDIPVFEIDITKKKVVEAIAKENQEQQKLSELIFQKEQEVNKTYYKALDLQFQLQIGEKQLNNKEEELEAQSLKFAHGSISLADLYATALDVLKTQKDYWDTRCDLYLAYHQVNLLAYEDAEE